MTAQGWTVGLDGDDTLWHNEVLFADTQARLREILGHHVAAEEIDRRLLAREKANLRLFGYGIKGFTLSMVETAIEVSDATVTAEEIQQLIDLGKAMLDSPVSVIDGVPDAVDALRAAGHRLVVITKGDLFDQEGKLARSGLAEKMDAIEIVSEKDEATYRAILDRHGIEPERFVMVGNSIRSDILPVLALGARAVHVPYHVTWAHEHVEDGDDLPAFERIERLGELVDWLAGVE